MLLVPQYCYLITDFPGSGIGRLMSVRFAQLGARLILWDINQTGNEETAQQVKAVGASVRTYTVDLSNREAIYKAAQQVCEVVDLIWGYTKTYSIMQ